MLLQLEDYALLLGTVGLFTILATVMYVTRDLDWYAVGWAGRGAGAPTVVLAVMTVLVGRFVSSPNGAVATYCRRIGLYVNVRKRSA